MGFRRRRRGRTDVDTLTRAHARHLLFGSSYLFRDEALPYATAADLVEAWEGHRPVILPLWLAHLPGSRPFAEYVARLIPAYGERRIVPGWAPGEPPGEHFGVHHRHGFRVDDDGRIVALQESEADYLCRVGELTAAEERAIATGRGGGPFAGPGASRSFWRALVEHYPTLAPRGAAAVD